MLRTLPVDRPNELYRLGNSGSCCVVSGFQGSYSIFAYPLISTCGTEMPEFVDLAAFEAHTDGVERPSGRVAGRRRNRSPLNWCPATTSIPSESARRSAV